MALLTAKTGLSPACSRNSTPNLVEKDTWAIPVSPQNIKANQTAPELAIYSLDSSRSDGAGPWQDLERITTLGLGLDVEEEETLQAIPTTSIPDICGGDVMYSQGNASSSGIIKPFHRWMKTLQRRARRPRTQDGDIVDENFPMVWGDAELVGGRRRSSSDSSFGYVTRVKTASISLAGTSVVGRSRRNTVRSSHSGRTELSSRSSFTGQRRSEDSMRLEQTSTADSAVTERLLQRRRILEELIRTEESYIGDIRFLMNVYVTILASLPTQHVGLRSSINRNLTDIVELHEDILGELHKAVPRSEYSQEDHVPPVQRTTNRTRHQRWHSLDSVPEGQERMLWLQDIPGVTAEPEIAAAVARVFGKRMHRFFVYEEYGAKYEMMIKDVANAHRTLPQWELYQKGLEALAASLGPAYQQMDHSRKSLTIGDLLVKPIQRICKYPLLFSELLKHTPVCDCPVSHAEIENVLARIREATAEMNRATDDPSVKSAMEKTWLLQDRLMFADRRNDAVAQSTIRSLGQIRLCGTLHVCWQTKEGVNGQYMIALLYKDCLCLATATKNDARYCIQACIGLDTVKLEDVDNSRGLQCHTAPFSWKIVFEIDHQLYEMIMTASNPREESQWKKHLSASIPSETHHRLEPPFCGSMSLNVKSLGTVFGKPGTVARRLSIHRATTVGPKSPMCQIILKNTSTFREPPSTHSGSLINRSQSLLTTNSRVPVLTPTRAERTRLEALLADVWSRDVLPFPGINARSRSEKIVRSSASSMMRKLSVASIASSFGKRSGSVSAAHRTMERAQDDQRRQYSASSSALVTLSYDFRFTELSMEKEFEEVQNRLPAIHDETERPNSQNSSVGSMDDVESTGTVRKRECSDPGVELQWTLDQIEMGVPALRTTSANSLQRSLIMAPPPRPITAGSEKENIFKAQMLEEAPGMISKAGSRWAKVNRGLIGGGLRSIFH